jgi:hypothetical protein
VTDPSWQPDPTGRNHYRWWDGSQWTDSVSTDGVVSLDPVQAAPPQAQVPVIQEQTPMAPMAPAAPPAPAVPTVPTAPTAPMPGTGDVPQFAPVVAEASKKSSPLKWIIPIVAVAAVGAGLFFFLGGDDDDGGGGGGLGVTEGEISEDEAAVFTAVSLKAGETIRMRAEPERRLDLKMVVFADSDTAEEWAQGLIDTGDGEEDFFTDVDDIIDLLFTDGDQLVSDNDLSDQVALFVVDDEFEGDFEADFFPALADGTYTIAAVAVDQGDEGEVRLIVEKSPDTFDPDDNFSDIDEFLSDDDLFLSDDPFFTDDDPFDPEN